MIGSLALLVALQWQPLATEVPAPAAGNESWSKVAVHESGAIARAWSGANEVWLQVAGGQVHRVNTVTKGTQDEPALAALPAGSLAAWVAAFDDRGGRDGGGYMGVYARFFAVDGSPIGPDFLVNEVTAGSQWRPMLAVAPGRLAFLFSGDLDNNGYARLMDLGGGAWLTGDVRYWTNPNGEQQDPVGAFLPDGRLRVVWKDSHTWATGGIGAELAWRDLAPDGAPLGLPERLCTPARPGDQLEPRIAVSPSGEVWVTWYEASGAWLKRGAAAPEFLGTGALPEPAPPLVVYEHQGDVYLWPDQLRANRYLPGKQARPQAAFAPDGTLWIAWHGPSWSSSTSDAFLRGFLR